MPTEATSDLLLRPADRDDLAAVADLHLQVRTAAVPAMPPVVYDAAFVREYVESWDLSTHELWLGERDGSLLGYAMVHDDWLHSLYVAPAEQGSGIGSALLDLAKGLRPGGFCLWVFESNEPARAFYRHHGLVDLETTDGSGNPERAPEVRMAWPGEDPLAFLRGLVDDVDAQLGDLLARRVALTRAIQPYRTTSGRDRGREAEIAREMARRAPVLGPERLARIVDVIVTESLDAGRG
ncbi:putative acetyltransferase [Nocardioides dokdonensis FR1436]|uniref:Putative acetyltransferase n=1 Tax=Nocardioides dokdonensis FR1436 TaxID=1300347 RepID=A0A1A9GNC2_9ACTN|nr:GNAT family N-acetyltransferase [Nocardioides dokdonensis]ANH39160.1 putative acetyltransferase [Nocardioides dokdonensis FR1436]